MPAQITLDGRVRPGDFNTVNLHTPGDLQGSVIFYIWGGGAGGWGGDGTGLS